MLPRSFYNLYCLTVSLLLLCLTRTTAKQTNDDSTFLNGKGVTLRATRYGPCSDGNRITTSTFGAAFYRENTSLALQLKGNTNAEDEYVTFNLTIFGYGETLYNANANPCDLGLQNLCPLTSTQSVDIASIIPLSEVNSTKISGTMFSLPDFEGQLTLSILSSSTQSEISCYVAELSNDRTFKHTKGIATVLGIFTIVAIIASFSTAIYGSHVQTIRKHYAHSFSVMLVFETLQSVYLTGAFSVNWPKACVAFWSNFAWASGMIFSGSMQSSIDNLVGSKHASTSEVGAQGGGTNSSISTGSVLSEIHRRALHGLAEVDSLQPVDYIVRRRHLTNGSVSNDLFAARVHPELPVPGTYSGFAGTLAEEGIPLSNAFMTGFLWFLSLLAIVMVTLPVLKISLDLLTRLRWIYGDRLYYFKSHWLGYTVSTILRTLVIGFYLLTFLALFEFSYVSPPGVTAIAAIVFTITFTSALGITIYLSYHAVVAQREHKGQGSSKPGVRFGLIRLFQSRKINNAPTKRHTNEKNREESVSHGHTSAFIFEDVGLIERFGFVIGRYNSSKWWFLPVWLTYQLVRACFLAGAVSRPLVQVFAVLVVDILGFVGLVLIRPFEGRRLNIFVTYLLAGSRVLTAALSAALDVKFDIHRLTAVRIGFAIIAIQSLLTVCLLLAILAGAITTYMSCARNCEDQNSGLLVRYRTKYIAHLDGNDLKSSLQDVDVDVEGDNRAESRTSSFRVSSVRRVRKVEDEDEDFRSEIDEGSTSHVDLINTRDANGLRQNAPLRTTSVYSSISRSSLPKRAKSIRPSWTARDFDDSYHCYQSQEEFELAEQQGSHTFSSENISPILQDPDTLRALQRPTSSLQRSSKRVNSDNVTFEEQSDSHRSKQDIAKRRNTSASQTMSTARFSDYSIPMPQMKPRESVYDTMPLPSFQMYTRDSSNGSTATFSPAQSPDCNPNSDSEISLKTRQRPVSSGGRLSGSKTKGLHYEAEICAPPPIPPKSQERSNTIHFGRSHPPSGLEIDTSLPIAEPDRAKRAKSMTNSSSHAMTHPFRASGIRNYSRPNRHQ